ncbi:hypothetical protein MTR67_003036 [Solanum verrucosum]|uniref:Small ribosomal subunit protein bS18c n=1 Tax=Solanum verrucosum TaxID=315347 RepID=A0AAF0T8Z8_SOLVR|nr:hypothetical protein MTR67_003036 [Solanum verrucosum]
MGPPLYPSPLKYRASLCMVWGLNLRPKPQILHLLPLELLLFSGPFLHFQILVGLHVQFWERSSLLNGLDESFDTLSDGMDGKLKEEARYFEFDPDEVEKDDYAYRADDLLAREHLILILENQEFASPLKGMIETTTEEVLRKAGFRNVRFLASFITEAGILLKRSKTGISVKAHRKIAMGIKTARAFGGLMPFTTMGTKHFVFGRTMEDLDADYEYKMYDPNFVNWEPL